MKIHFVCENFDIRLFLTYMILYLILRLKLSVQKELLITIKIII